MDSNLFQDTSSVGVALALTSLGESTNLGRVGEASGWVEFLMTLFSLHLSLSLALSLALCLSLSLSQNLSLVH